MTARARTDIQETAIRAIAISFAEERAARALAESEARAEVERKVQAARDRTTALIYKAHYEYKVTKAAITREGLGASPGNNAAKHRLDEYMERMGLIPGESVLTIHDLPNMAAKLGPSGMTANRQDDEVLVKFTNYTHVDLGEGLTGTVRLSASYDVIDTENANEALLSALEYPLWGLKLVETDEYTEAIA